MRCFRRCWSLLDFWRYSTEGKRVHISILNIYCRGSTARIDDFGIEKRKLTRNGRCRKDKAYSISTRTSGRTVPEGVSTWKDQSYIIFLVCEWPLLLCSTVLMTGDGVTTRGGDISDQREHSLALPDHSHYYRSFHPL